MAQQGPSGGNGGSAYSDNKPGTQITQVIVTWGAYVNTLETHWSDGTVTKHGAVDGPNIDAFVLNPGDLLVGIVGQTGNLDGDGGPYVATISFTSKNGSNSNVYGGAAPGPGGGVFGSIIHPGNNFVNLSPYSYSAPAGQAIVGFWGRSGNYIDQIGIFTA
ncbi:MAG: jacalin-like lectin [Terracidiphilus sp.]